MAPPMTDPDNAEAGLVVAIVAAALLVPDAEPLVFGPDPDEPVPVTVATYEPLLGAPATVLKTVEVPVADALMEERPSPPCPAPWEGERAPPELTMLLAEIAVDKVEAALETDLIDEEPAPLVAVELAEEMMLLELETAEQDRSYSGVVLSLLPTIPKLGFGVTGAESCSVNQKVLTLPNEGHPTSSQYVFAFSREGTAWPETEPLTGHPVSVIQTSLPPTAA